MGREDWDYVPIPKAMISRIDEFLKKKGTKRLGIQSRAELLRYALNKILEENRFD